VKKAFVSIVTGWALACSAASHAADNMQGMSMNDGATPSADADNSMSHGEIKRIDAASGKLTIKHGPLENLGMGAMTMVFKAVDPAMLSQVKIGDRIDFVAEQVNGALTVVKLRKQ
jgi:Cu/Ag efflux protein CusF